MNVAREMYDQFAEQGYAGPVRVLSAEECLRFLQAADDSRKRPPLDWNKGHPASSRAFYKNRHSSRDHRGGGRAAWRRRHALGRHHTDPTSGRRPPMAFRYRVVSTFGQDGFCVDRHPAHQPRFILADHSRLPPLRCDRAGGKTPGRQRP